MKALFVHGHRFKKDKDCYYSDGQFTYDLWRNRYLRYFQEVYVASRIEVLNESPENKNVSNGPGVFHVELPDLSKVKTRILKSNKTKQILKSIIIDNNIDIVIARLPSLNGLKAIQVAKQLNKKCIIEMVGDPFDALWYHGSWKGKILAPFTFIKYKFALEQLDNIIFVTETYLQRRYKKNYKQYHTTNISNVNITVGDTPVYNRKKLKINENNYPVKIAMIGSYSSKYKGIDIAIEVISKLNEEYKINTELSILGPGDAKVYENKINQLNLKNKIKFVGTLKSGDMVLSWLDKHDIYIQPSFTEGLPRGLIEAMSRGLPSVATNVGGIPELLRKDVQVEVKDSKNMAKIIYTLITNSDLYFEHSKYNFLKSKSYDSKVLEKKRDEFYSNLLEE